MCVKEFLKYLNKLLLLISLIMFFSGCERYHLRKSLERIMDSTIVLPSEVSMAFDGEVVPIPDSLNNVPKMIVYVDSTGCSMCRLMRFDVYKSLFDMSRATRAFEMVLLVAGGKIEGIPISRIISDLEFTFPVYIDEKCTFLKDNPSIPNDTRLQSMFVNEAGNPLFVGDPTHSQLIMNLFTEALNAR